MYIQGGDMKCLSSGICLELKYVQENSCLIHSVFWVFYLITNIIDYCFSKCQPSASAGTIRYFIDTKVLNCKLIGIQNCFLLLSSSLIKQFGNSFLAREARYSNPFFSVQYHLLKIMLISLCFEMMK